MIAVIADDLTGAAELGGIGLTYGLDVELAMSVNPQSNAELLVIATDARSVSESEAIAIMSEVSAALHAMKPQLIFKKVDSVLRGHVIPETVAQLAVLGLAKALIVPANPALGRILIDGHYYVQGELIHQTHFLKDPEFPITESNVLKRLARNDVSITVQPSTEALIQPGIVIGEVGTQGDLQAWASRVDEQTLPGGGSGFFTAILGSHYVPKRAASLTAALGQCRLYVCGSAFGHSVELVKKAAMTSNFVCYMPDTLMHPGDQETTELENWVATIVACFQRHEQVIMAIESESVENASGQTVHLRTVMAKAVKHVLDQFPVDELIIEGGSTASAVLREMGITRLAVTQELGAGVVRSAVVGQDHLHITVKPGSYRWSPDLWTFNSH
ncbi:four-carbon acid sugar kinase family protein [Spirosoma validum]|uniref:Four-carbon acid sugar kinase family protein n=1 Tax=Spirosoma validum TaxID=2771355 RepID=A0A927GH99_9BACT|nr:four-carbon acid sugar kinase family protein [Spirosoma validum]MBD2757807.1 four-carbon acid sugar kinase family protein [Spirosoma validum]